MKRAVVALRDENGEVVETSFWRLEISFLSFLNRIST